MMINFRDCSPKVFRKNYKPAPPIYYMKTLTAIVLGTVTGIVTLTAASALITYLCLKQAGDKMSGIGNYGLKALTEFSTIPYIENQTNNIQEIKYKK